MECHSFRLSNGLFSFSPNGLFAAFCNQQRLTVCLISDFQPIRVIQCSEIVEVGLLYSQLHLTVLFFNLSSHFNQANRMEH
jgi:hypothetical protein